MFSSKKIINALKKYSSAKNISYDVIKKVAVESLEESYIRVLNDNPSIDLPDPNVKVVLNDKEIKFYQIKVISKDINDDMLEISLDDAKKICKDKQLNYGDKIEICDDNIDTLKLSKIFVKQFKNLFNKKINNEEKTILYENYKDHIGEIVIGVVEKINSNGILIKIGNNSAYLYRRDMIGDEIFSVGQQIKVYLEDTSNNEKKSISVTRANEGFLRKLLEEEIFEIYDKTVIIKKIVRKAGNRSKVAVYSEDKNVSAIGSCIGKNGVRINKIIEQLGDVKKHNSEKIDIVVYNDNINLYIIDALKPAEIIGINVDENNKKAICIVKDGQYLKAIGFHGENVNLASQLTGYALTIFEESDAKKQNISFLSKEEIENIENQKQEEFKKSEFAKQSAIYKENFYKKENQEKNNDDNDENKQGSFDENDDKIIDYEKYYEE